MIGLLGFGDNHSVQAYNDKVYVRLYKWDSFWGRWYTEIILATNDIHINNIYDLPVWVKKCKDGWKIIGVCDDASKEVK